MSHTIYVTRIILRPLSALFGLQFMLPMEKSVTFTGACANEIIPNGLLTKRKREVMLECKIYSESSLFKLLYDTDNISPCS
jgi:hypothetical protein